MNGRRYAVIGLLVVSALGAACSSKASEQGAPTTTDPGPFRKSATLAPTTTAARQPGESDGAYVFRTQCAGCHGPKGEGNLGPTLVGIANSLSVAQQETIVRNGEGRMPPFSPALSDAEIAAVIDYTRTQLK